MLTQEYIHIINSVIKDQSENLLKAQNQIATAYYVRRSGELIQSTSDSPRLNDMSVQIAYPKYIRALDIKKGRGGKVKGNYEPIYNKYVYGFLYIGIYKRLYGLFSGLVKKTITEQLNIKL